MEVRFIKPTHISRSDGSKVELLRWNHRDGKKEFYNQQGEKYNDYRSLDEAYIALAEHERTIIECTPTSNP